MKKFALLIYLLYGRQIQYNKKMVLILSGFILHNVEKSLKYGKKLPFRCSGSNHFFFPKVRSQK